MTYMTRREYLRRRRKRRRLIFYLCALLFALIISLLLGILISRLSDPAPSNQSGSSYSLLGDSSSHSSASAATSSAGAPEPSSTAPVVVPDGYELRQLSAEDMHKGTLILINKNYEYLFPTDQTLISMYDLAGDAYSVSGTDVQVDQIAAQPLNTMLTSFYEHSSIRNLLILCGYRTKEESQELFDASVREDGLEHAERYIMRPGYSEHHSALAVDLGVLLDDGGVDYYSATGDYAWLTQNCHKYGFIVRYPDEKASITQIDYESWHFRYLGIPNATAIYNESLCLEEYMDFIKHYTADGQHYTVSTADGQYEIYYALGTQVPVPAQQSYEISGNNVDGFIVTVKVS